MFGKVNTEKYVVVRSNMAGVWVGELMSIERDNVSLNNARKIWSWEGAKTTCEIATHGVSKAGTKATSIVRDAVICGVCEVISMEPCAVESVLEASWDE